MTVLPARLALAAALLAGPSTAAWQGPVAAPDTGYGASGSDSVAVDTVANAHWAGNPVFVFHPDRSGPFPTVLYAHGYGGNDTLYQRELLRHLASRGFAAVFVPYRTYGATVAERYATLLDGYAKAATERPDLLDTARVGIMGHSFGAGASPWLAHELFRQRGWGASGRFLFLTAPWYSYFLGDTALARIPADTRSLVLLFADDTVNDHRMGLDLAAAVPSPDSLKDLLLARSDTVDGYTYQADHSLPSQYSPENGEYDAYDARLVFRLLDGLADAAFAGSALGVRVALGHGDSAQVDPGGSLVPLVWSASPAAERASSEYDNPCDSAINPRADRCETTSLPEATPAGSATVRIDGLRLRSPGAAGLALYSPSGRLERSAQGDELSLAHLARGVHLLRIRTADAARPAVPVALP